MIVKLHVGYAIIKTRHDEFMVRSEELCRSEQNEFTNQRHEVLRFSGVRFGGGGKNKNLNPCTSVVSCLLVIPNWYIYLPLYVLISKCT